MTELTEAHKRIVRGAMKGLMEKNLSRHDRDALTKAIADCGTNALKTYETFNDVRQLQVDPRDFVREVACGMLIPTFLTASNREQFALNAMIVIAFICSAMNTVDMVSGNVEDRKAQEACVIGLEHLSQYFGCTTSLPNRPDFMPPRPDAT